MSTITNVAVVGASGRIGSHFANSLLASGKHTVTAISRHDSSASPPAGVVNKPVNFDNEDELVEALKGQQFLIITLGARAPKDLHSRIVKAAIKAGVEYIVPNAYGADIKNEVLVKEEMLTGQYAALCNEIESLGGNYICLVCGPWYGWGFNMGEAGFGIDIKNKKVTFFDDGNTKVNLSTWDQCGRAIAGLLALPESEVAKYKNKPIYTSSFRVSQRDILDSLNRVSGTTDADWEIKYEESAKRVAEGKELLSKGDFSGFAKAMYSRLFYPNGDSDYESSKGLANEQLGLPKEDLDAESKKVVEAVQ
ncbi:NAD(P)-binding protein [Aaosphaeria arxii CBS 175.79]|uniref:NAD(P)-binding protein n=1 Tax=Aaosphaeria arxii CBS 175.79 TaxID=1450172 RepID=A0A6A5X8W8_9PLEO|nr:NAD(P)-binding protein [Aaosphaeria arxii CBS 175.79]KAF2009408.1 NAD(P)-binding protein [Aaosphaeria arxii CBS 175.79]